MKKIGGGAYFLITVTQIKTPVKIIVITVAKIYVVAI